MTRTILALTAGLACAALIVVRFEADVLAGGIVGYLFGAAIGISALVLQRRTLATHPERMMNAVALGFLMKLGGIAIGAVALRYTPALYELADWRGFIGGYAGAVLIALFVGAFDSERTLKRETVA